MNKPIPKTNSILRENVRVGYAALIILSFAFLVGCSSTCHKRTSMMSVLQEQSELLRKLESERAQDAFLRKVERDQTLLDGERHLREAIRALLNANEAMKSAIKP